MAHQVQGFVERPWNTVILAKITNLGSVIDRTEGMMANRQPPDINRLQRISQHGLHDKTKSPPRTYRTTGILRQYSSKGQSQHPGILLFQFDLIQEEEGKSNQLILVKVEPKALEYGQTSEEMLFFNGVGSLAYFPQLLLIGKGLLQIKVLEFYAGHG